MKKKLRISIVGGLSTLLLLSGLPMSSLLSPANAAPAKITICHRTKSVTNPYRMITVSNSSINKSRGHGDHTGSVFDPNFSYPSNAKNWGDIIPDANTGSAYGGDNQLDFNWILGSNWAAGSTFFPGGANAQYCSRMTAGKFIQVQRDAGVSDADIAADLEDQEANEDAAVKAALGSFSAGNLSTVATTISVTTNAATNNTGTQARINGTIKAGTKAIKWKFEWGTSTNLGNSTTLSTSSITSATTSVYDTITGLTDGTTYYFRVVGVTDAGDAVLEGTMYGEILNFVASSTAPSTQAIVFSISPTKKYGDANFDVSAISKTPNASGSASKLKINFTSQTRTICEISGGTLVSSDSSTVGTISILAAGDCTIRAAQPGGSVGATNYDPATDVDQTFTITPALLTIKAEDKSKNVGAADPSNSVTITAGVINGDNVTVSGVTYTRTSGETVGTYTITPASGTSSSTNYVVQTRNTGTLTISAAPVITPNVPKSPPKAVPIKETIVIPAKKFPTPDPKPTAAPSPGATPSTESTPKVDPSPSPKPSASPSTSKSPEVKSSPKVDPLPQAVVPLKDGDNNPIPLKEAEVRNGPGKAEVDEEGKLKITVPIGFKGNVEVEITPKNENNGPTEKQIIEIPVEGPKPPVEPEKKAIDLPRLLPPTPGKINVVGLKEAVNVSWKEDPEAQAYEIYADKKLVCTTVYSTCSIPSENGVKKSFEVVTIKETGNKAIGTGSGQALAKGTLLAIVYFDTDKDVLTPESIATLNKLSNDLRALGLRNVSLSGHTDTQAASNYNQALSSRRSVRVETFLDNKVLNAVVDKSSSGEKKLAIKTPDEVNQAKNRRVEIRVR